MTFTRGCSPGISAIIFPAIRPSCRRTWKAPAACGSPIISMPRRRATARVIGAISRGAAFDPLLNEKGAQFDASKFSWIGSANNEVSVCVALQSSGITKFEDVLTKPLTVGSTGVGDDTYQFPTAHQRGARHQVQDRHRLSGRQRRQPGARARRGPGPLRLVVVEHQDDADGLDRPAKRSSSWRRCRCPSIPDLPDVPLIMDFAKTDEQRQIFKLIFARQVMGRPFLGAARHARRSPRRAAPGLCRDHEGQGVS